jgi:hypothetical protein
MGQRVQEAYQETIRYIVLALKAVIFWRRPPPVETVDQLVRFVETRSKYVSQITLYGYIRTRVGTRYASMMEDAVFAGSVNMAKWEIYLACLCDLAVYVTALLGRDADADEDEMGAFVIHLVEAALASEPVPAERPQGFDDVRIAIRDRAGVTAWDKAAEREAAFDASLAALVEWAPVADELKILDVEIVRFSIRFKWKSVRDQIGGLLDVDAVLADWRD